MSTTLVLGLVILDSNLQLTQHSVIKELAQVVMLRNFPALNSKKNREITVMCGKMVRFFILQQFTANLQ